MWYSGNLKVNNWFLVTQYYLRDLTFKVDIK